MPQPPSPISPELQAAWPCLRAHAQGILLDVSVSPNAKKTELVGWHDGALRIRLQAPPVDGAANDALRKWLARQLNTQQHRVALHQGATSRRKQVLLQCEFPQLLQWLESQTALQKKHP